MKRILFAFCLTCTLNTSAQELRSVEFNFSDPTSLNKPIDVSNMEIADEINISDIILRGGENDCIELSFERKNGRGCTISRGFDDSIFWDPMRFDEEGHRIAREIHKDFYLFVARGSSFTVTAKDVELDGLIFGERTSLANLTIIEPIGKGYYDPLTANWQAKGEQGITELTYQNNGKQPEIRSLTIQYHIPQNSLKPTSTYPNENEKIYAFNKYILTFDSKVELKNGQTFQLKGPEGIGNIPLNASLSNDSCQVTLSLPTEGSYIDAVGEYTLTIPEKAIIQKTTSADKFFTKEQTYHFSIIPNYATFELESVNPAEGSVDQLEDGIQLTFTDVVSNTISSERIYITNRENKRVRTARLVKSEDNPKMVYVRFEEDNKLPIPAEILNEKIGYYTLIIPEGYINNYLYDDLAEDKGKSQGAQFNPEIKVTYNVGNAVYPDDPTLLHKANNLLATSGVGYPATDSEARVALQKLIDSIDEGQVTNNLLEVAIDAFYSETNIEQPQNAKYYILSAVSSNGDELYLRYSNGAITLTNDSIDATHFLAQVNEDKTLTLISPDGKYLQQLMPDNDNISNEYDEIKNNLTLAQFRLDGKNDVDCFGLWSIKCWIATGEGNNNMSAFARVDFSSSKFATSILFPSLKYFEEEMTNAFRLTETNAPVPEAKYIIDPEDESSIDGLYKITVSFTNINEVDITENAKENISLVGSSTLQYRPTKIGLVEGKKNEYKLFFDDIAADTYTLIIPKGTFTFNHEGNTVSVQQIKATYTVLQSSSFKDDFLYKYNVYYYKMPKIDTKVRDIDLNNLLTLVIYEKNTFGLSDKGITITRTGDNDTIAIGHFVVDESFIDPEVQGVCTAFKLILDNPIQSGNLQMGTYQYNIPAATFGDANFALWLRDPHSVPKDSCHVNKFLSPMISVDNDKACMVFAPQQQVSMVKNLAQITVTFPYHTNVSIQGENTIHVLERYTGYTFTTSFVRVEGTSNQFRFDSEEILTKNTSEGGYLIVVPQYLFKADNDYLPMYDNMELYYYGQGADAIETIDREIHTDVIYDLSGRRVKDMNKAGIYIVGGHKVVVK